MIGNPMKTLTRHAPDDREDQGEFARTVPLGFGRAHLRRSTSSRPCPPWCMEAHVDERPDERIHNAWLHSVELSAVPLAGQRQRLWLDLVLGPGDYEPRVHLQIEDRSLVELTIAEARSIGTQLIGLAALGMMEVPPSTPTESGGSGRCAHHVPQAQASSRPPPAAPCRSIQKRIPLRRAYRVPS
ncbi:DUF6907 domain-containing protein [Microbispora bryophytorum]|uniref:DUF6907 domain-containing protein n=1 Tax=Microbispora bryophytorum TaxID=1460882 RepID=UPI003F4D33C7